MSDQPKLERLLRILMLLSGGFGQTIEELSEKLGMSKRTVYRYLETLKNAGFIINRQDNVIHIDKNSPYLRDIGDLLHFTKEEAWILNKAILALDDETFIKQNLATKLYALYDLKGVPYPVVKKENSNKVIGLIRAIENKERVNLSGYQSSHSSTVCDRVVEPFEFTLNYNFIWAFETETRCNKLFKTARIKEVKAIEEPWQYEKLHKSGMTDVFRISGEKQIPITLSMTMRAANLLAEEYPMTEEFIKTKDNGEFIFEGWVSSFIGIGRFVLGLMDEITINNPKSLKDYLNKRINKKIF